MASSKATTVEQYLSELPDDRRDAIVEVREAILTNMPEGVKEVMSFGMIAYEVPLSIFPDTYNKKPLMVAALASQKNHMAVYLTHVYANEASSNSFRERYLETGKKLDMGKSCVRFKKIEHLPVDLIGAVIGEVSLDEFLDGYRSS